MANHAKAAENTWATVAEMPTEREEFGVAVVDRKIYAIGGYNYRNAVLSVNEVYDPATNTWTVKKPMPTPRAGFGIAVYQNKIYVIGGRDYNHQPLGVNEVYDPATDTWEKRKDMPTPRKGLTANVVNGKIYLIGGLESVDGYPPKISSLNEVYDPVADSWIVGKPLQVRVCGHASAVVDNKIYVIGGESLEKTNQVCVVNVTQIYDPKTDTWSLGTPCPVAVRYAAAGGTTGVMAPKKIYVIGGIPGLSSESTGINQVYDPERDFWTLGTSMPTSRLWLSVAVVNDMLYALGGTWMILNPQSPIYAVNERYIPFGYGTTTPTDTTPPQEPPQSEPFPTTWAVAAAGSVAVVGASIVFYFKRFRKNQRRKPMNSVADFL
ncbi:MAG: Kelch repeat-containing protein [Candidatus Bathyarchaeales archaeon]